MDNITIQYLNYLQYGPYTSYNTVQFQFFFLLNTIFSTMKILTATTNTLLQANNIYTKQNTRQENTKTKGVGGNIPRTIHAMGQHRAEAYPIS